MICCMNLLCKFGVFVDVVVVDLIFVVGQFICWLCFEIDFEGFGMFQMSVFVWFYWYGLMMIVDFVCVEVMKLQLMKVIFVSFEEDVFVECELYLIDGCQILFKFIVVGFDV